MELRVYSTDVMRLHIYISSLKSLNPKYHVLIRDRLRKSFKNLKYYLMLQGSQALFLFVVSFEWVTRHNQTKNSFLIIEQSFSEIA